MKKKALAIVLALTMAVLGGCSGGGSQTGGTTAAAAEGTKAGSETAGAAGETKGAAAAQTGAGEIDTLRIGVGAMSVNFNPCKDMGIQALRMIYNVHDRLM